MVAPGLDLSGRVAVVTGASRGIGRSVALDLGRRGAAVACASRDLARAEETATTIAAEGGTAVALLLDIRDEGSVRTLAAAVARRLAPADILVNNAGVAAVEPLVETSLDAWRNVLDTNLTGAFLCTRELAPQLARSGRGAVVNVGSINGVVAMRGLASYCASKGGLHHFTRQAALELAPDGIRVNCVAPGFVRTEMFDTSHPEERKRGIAELHALGRVADPDEIAYAVSFLCSDLASFVTGAVLMVDGGLTAQFGFESIA